MRIYIPDEKLDMEVFGDKNYPVSYEVLSFTRLLRNFGRTISL